MIDKEIIEDLVELGGASKKLQSIWKVNTKEGKLNCANCAIAVEYTLSGKPTSALPWTYETIFRNGKKINKISYTRGTHYKILEKEFDNIFIKNISLNYLRKKLRNGQRGIVFAYNKNSTIGHFFNVINENGIVKFLDGQTGKAAKLNYDIYELLPTNFKKLE